MKAEKRLFTLVELLGVMALISILATLGFSGYSYAMSSAKDKSARATVKRMEAGIEAIKLKQGYYPSTKKDGAEKNKSGTFATISIHLSSPRSTIDLDKIDGLYFYEMKDADKMKTDASPLAKVVDSKKIKALTAFLKVVELDTLIGQFVPEKGNSSTSDTFHLVDPWGNPIYYCYPAKIRSSGFDLISAGPDGLFSKDNADKPDNKKTNDFRDKDDGTPLCDDILND